MKNSLDELRRARSALASDELRQRRGELVDVRPLRAAAADAISRARAGLQRLPTRIGRRLGLGASDVALIAQLVDEELDGLARAFEKIGGGQIRLR